MATHKNHGGGHDYGWVGLWAKTASASYASMAIAGYFNAGKYHDLCPISHTDRDLAEP